MIGENSQGWVRREKKNERRRNKANKRRGMTDRENSQDKKMEGNEMR